MVGAKLGELATDLFQVEARYFFVDVLGQDIDPGGVFLDLFPKLNLGERLIGEAVGHDKGGVTGGTTEVHKATLRKEVNTATIRESVFINRTFVVGFDFLNFHSGGVVEFIDFDFVIEVTDVTDDGLVLHFGHMVSGNDAVVTGGGHIDIAPTEGVFDGEDAVTFHRGLQRANRVDFSHHNLSAHTLERGGATFTDIAVTADHADFTGNHDIGGAFDPVEEGLAATVKVVEFRLGDGIVHVDGGNEEFAGVVHFVEAVHPSSGFFGNTFPILQHFVPAVWFLGMYFFEEVFNDRLFHAAGIGLDPVTALFKLVTLVDKKGGVAAIVHDELRSGTVGPGEGLIGAPPIFLKGFALPRKDRHAEVFGDIGRSVILRGKDVTGTPAHIRTQRL